MQKTRTLESALPRYWPFIALVLAAIFLTTFTATALADPRSAKQPEHGRFHHVHLNVSDIAKTTAFYEKVFGVAPVSYGGRQPALMAERAFIFLNQAAFRIA